MPALQIALRQSEDRFKAFFESSAFGAARAQFTTGRFLEVNETLCKMTGYSRQELMERTLLDITHPDDRARTIQSLQEQSRNTPSFRHIEKRFLRKDGQSVWVHVAKHVVMGEQGDPESFAAVIIDVSASKESEHLLAANLNELKLSQEVGKVRTFDWNILTNEVFWSANAEELFGLPPNGFGGSVEHWRQCVLPSDLAQLEARMADTFSHGIQDWRAEYRVVRTDGSTKWIETQAKITYDPHGRPIRMFGISLDINERKEVDDALRRSETEAKARADELAAILDAVPTMTFIAHDPACQKMTSSRAAYEQLRLPQGANTSKSAPQQERPANFRPMKDGRELSSEELPVQRAAATGRAVRDCELSLVFDDGTVREIFGHAVPLMDAEGAVRGAVGAFVDITARKRVDELIIKEEIHRQLLKHEMLAREEERRRLARELHDESGQMLASLLAGLQTIERAKTLKAAKGKVAALRELTSSAIKEMSRLAQDLHPIVLDDLGLAVALKHYVSGYSELHGIQAELNIVGLDSRRLPQVLERGLYRIVQEALTNVARHAHANRVSLLVNVGTERLVMTIIDDGCGFAAVEPRSSGHMGCQGMRERAAMLTGELTIESELGQGTRITVAVPIAGERPGSH
jgi:PAS domain S-box-containing protein